VSSSPIGSWSGRTKLMLNAHDLGEGGTQAVRNIIITSSIGIVNTNHINL